MMFLKEIMIKTCLLYLSVFISLLYCVLSAPLCVFLPSRDFVDMTSTTGLDH